MIVKTKAIVISSIKFQEKSLIVKCFTLSDGLKSYFVRDAFSNRKSNQKNSYFQPMTILEIEAVHKNKGTLENFKEIKISTAFNSIHSDVYKSTIVLFISEILHYSIHEEEKNESLFLYLETALQWLDNHNDISNFHLILLLEMSKHFGFFPDVSKIDFKYFDMIEGGFSNYQTVSSISENETNLFRKLIHLKFDHNQKVISNIERQFLIKILIDFYSLHLNGFKKPKSLEVLKDVFQ